MDGWHKRRGRRLLQGRQLWTHLSKRASRRSPRVRILGAGVVGTVFAGMGILDHFVSFLLFLGIAIPPIAGIYVADFFFVRGQNYDTATLEHEPPIGYPAFIAWFGASAIAQATASGAFTMTGIPSCDAILVSFALYLFLSKGLGLRELTVR